MMDITTLGLSDCGMRMARGLQRYGLVVTDMGGLVCKGRCDQTFSAAERSEMNAQFVKLYPYIRFLQTQSDATRYIGGNSDPVGPYCANDR